MYNNIFRLFLSLSFILFYHIGYSQASGDYRSKQNGLWSASSTWETFDGANWIAASNSPTFSNGFISILNGHIVTINAPVTIDQTVIIFGGKVILSSGILTVNNGIGDDLRILGDYERTSSTTTMTINSDAIVLCDNNGKYIHNVDGGSLPTITWQVGSLLNIKNSVSSNLNQSFWDVLIEGGNTSTLSNNDTSRTMIVRNNLTQTAGTFYLKNGGISGGVHTLEILGNYLHTGGFLGWNFSNIQNSSRTNLIIGGNYSLLGSAGWTGFVSLTDCQSGIFFNGTNEQTFTTVFPHATGAVRDRFYISENHPGVHEVYVGTTPQNTINGLCTLVPPIGYLPWPTTGTLLKSFTINNPSGVTLRDSRNIDQNFYRKNGSITLFPNSVISYNIGASLHYNGSTAITTENPEFPVLNGPTNLVINNVAAVTLHADRTVLGNLEFVQGILSTGSCNSSTNNTMLVLGSSSNVINAGLGKYVNGILRKIGNTEFTFTIGGNGRYAPVTISAPSNITDHFTACYVNGDADGQGFNRNLREASLGTISPCEYWNVNRTNGSSNVKVTLGWDTSRSCNFINSLNDIKVARWNGSLWQDVGNSIQTGTVSSGLVTSQEVTNFSPFAISTQSVDIYASAAWVDDCTTVGDGKFFNTSGTGIDLISQEPGNTFQQNFGVHLQNSNTLILRGAEIKTFKNNSSNVCSASMRYRFFSDGATPGAFSTMTIPFYSDCNTSQNEFLLGGGPCSAGQQKWQRVVADGTTSPYSPINLTNLPPGNYTLQIFYELTGSNSSANQCNETFVYNNNGNFYTASFTIVEMPILTTIQPTQCGGSGSIMISGLPANKVFEVSYLYNGVTVGPISATTNSSGEIVLNNLALGNYSGINLFSNSCNITLPNTVTIANPTVPSLSITSTDNTVCSTAPSCVPSGTNVVINEVRHWPSGAQGIIGTGREYIELYNPTCSPIDISCFILGTRSAPDSNPTGPLQTGGSIIIPSGTILQPKSHYVIGTSSSSLDPLAVDLKLDLVLSNNCSTGNFVLTNGDGWLALYNNIGQAIDGLFWTVGANQSTKITTPDDDLNDRPCVPNSVGTCTTTGITLLGPNEIYASNSALMNYVGISTPNPLAPTNLTFSRFPDGAAWQGQLSGTISGSNCNSVCDTSTPAGTCNGTATVNVATGSGSYSYQWSSSANNQSTQTATALCDGTHTVVVTDLVSNCQNTISVTINTVSISAPTASVTVQPTCTTPTGTIDITAPALAANEVYEVTGTAPVVAAQTNTTGDFTGLAPGSYNVTVLNTVTGCESTALALTVNPIPANPAAPTASVTVQPTCPIPTGTIVVTAPALAANEVYEVTGTAPVVAAQINTTGDFTGLAPGSYNVTVLNTVTGCESTALALTVNPIPANPASPTASVTVHPTCPIPTGTIVVTAPALAANELYEVTGTAPVVAAQTNTTGDFTGLAPGSYNVTVLNSVTGCVSTTLSLTVNPIPANPAAPTASVTVQPTCATPSGTIVVTAPIGVNLEYSIDNGVSYQSSTTFSGLAPNTSYTIIVRDSSTGCSSSSSNIIINSVPSSPVVSTVSGCNGASFEVTASVVSGVATYQWYDGSSNLLGTTATIVVTQSGTYEVRVTVDSCTTIEFVTVQVLPCSIPKGISPNNDGDNDTWDLSGLNVQKAQIFNRYGVEVYSRTNYTNQWDGRTNSGDELPTATYYYVLSLPNGEVKTGWVYINRQQ
jgi:gliding motility-associated-like protein